MKVLVIDDEKLVLLPIQKRLSAIGYKVIIETNGLNALKLYKAFKPDLIIIDIHMPLVSGLDIIKYIRKEESSSVPIMILSGNSDDDVITQGFDLGIDDFMKKPISLNEICARTKRLIGLPKVSHRPQVRKIETNDHVLIQRRSVGVVIPCYNEEERLLKREFVNFIDANSGYYLCFVNDGSTDNTLHALRKLAKGREEYIKVYNCKENRGKAEAVRKGMLYLAEHKKLDYIGFLDADLSTDFRDFEDLVKTIENSDFKIVSGSRIQRMGARISKDSMRAIISSCINFIIRKILAMNFKDTQCGAKVFRADVVELLFQQKFITKWLFDVEIFMRMRQKFTLKKSKLMICEQPLKRWEHVDGSKLSMKDSAKIIFQLIRIAWNYTGGNNNFKEKNQIEPTVFKVKSSSKESKQNNFSALG